MLPRGKQTVGAGALRTAADRFTEQIGSARDARQSEHGKRPHERYVATCCATYR